MKNNIIIFVYSIVLILCSCQEDTAKKNTEISNDDSNFAQVNTNNSQNLNISFLLDLSDRINPEKYPNPTMEYYMRDVEYIKSVSEAFYNHLQRKKVRQMKDKIQVFFDPEPRNQNINKISEDLRFGITRNSASLDLLEDIKISYSNKPLKIYEFAITDNAYVGSDTWRFFKTKVKDFCIDEDYRNILVILTDGYIYHKDTKIKENNLTTYLTPQYIRDSKLNNTMWEERYTDGNYGFLPATDDLKNLEVLVLGVNPDKKNDFEEDVIVKYWRDWFINMGVGRYEIKTAELPSNMDKIIKDFILK